MNQHSPRAFQDALLERERVYEGIIKFYLVTDSAPNQTPLPQSIRGLERMYSFWQGDPRAKEAFDQSNAYLHGLKGHEQRSLLEGLETTLSWIKDEALLEQLNGLAAYLSKSTSDFDRRLAISLTKNSQ